MKANFRDRARLDIARELDRIERLRAERRELMGRADLAREETKRLVEKLQQMLDRTLH
jgi:hypothetical protein